MLVFPCSNPRVSNYHCCNWLLTCMLSMTHQSKTSNKWAINFHFSFFKGIIYRQSLILRGVIRTNESQCSYWNKLTFDLTSFSRGNFLAYMKYCLQAFDWSSNSLARCQTFCDWIFSDNFCPGDISGLHCLTVLRHPFWFFQTVLFWE